MSRPIRPHSALADLTPPLGARSYPESFNSSNSKEVDTFLTSKLCEYMLDIRNGYVHLREAGHNRVKALELIGKLIPGFVSARPLFPRRT